MLVIPHLHKSAILPIVSQISNLHIILLHKGKILEARTGILVIRNCNFNVYAGDLFSSYHFNFAIIFKNYQFFSHVSYLHNFLYFYPFLLHMISYNSCYPKVKNIFVSTCFDTCLRGTDENCFNKQRSSYLPLKNKKYLDCNNFSTICCDNYCDNYHLP